MCAVSKRWLTSFLSDPVLVHDTQEVCDLPACTIDNGFTVSVIWAILVSMPVCASLHLSDWAGSLSTSWKDPVLSVLPLQAAQKFSLSVSQTWAKPPFQAQIKSPEEVAEKVHPFWVWKRCLLQILSFWGPHLLVWMPVISGKVSSRSRFSDSSKKQMPFQFIAMMKWFLGKLGPENIEKNSLSMLYKSSPTDLTSVLYSRAPGITWKLSDFKESGKKQRPLKASKIYKLLLHSLRGEMVLCVWGLQEKNTSKVFSVKSGLPDLQTIKNKPDPRDPNNPLLWLVSRELGESKSGMVSRGPLAANSAHRHLDSKFPSNPHWPLQSLTHFGCHGNNSGNPFPDQNQDSIPCPSWLGCQMVNRALKATLFRDLNVLFHSSPLLFIQKCEWKGFLLPQA